MCGCVCEQDLVLGLSPPTVLPVDALPVLQESQRLALAEEVGKMRAAMVEIAQQSVRSDDAMAALTAELTASRTVVRALPLSLSPHTCTPPLHPSIATDRRKVGLHSITIFQRVPSPLHAPCPLKSPHPPHTLPALPPAPPWDLNTCRCPS